MEVETTKCEWRIVTIVERKPILPMLMFFYLQGMQNLQHLDISSNQMLGDIGGEHAIPEIMRNPRIDHRGALILEDVFLVHRTSFGWVQNHHFSYIFIVLHFDIWFVVVHWFFFCSPIFFNHSEVRKSSTFEEDERLGHSFSSQIVPNGKKNGATSCRIHFGFIDTVPLAILKNGGGLWESFGSAGPPVLVAAPMHRKCVPTALWVRRLFLRSLASVWGKIGHWPFGSKSFTVNHNKSQQMQKLPIWCPHVWEKPYQYHSILEAR